MSQERPSANPLFTHIDVTTHSPTEKSAPEDTTLAGLLSHLIAGQDRQNELLEELVQQMGSAQRQRAAELNQWKQANPELAKQCRRAAETLGQVQTSFLESLAEEIEENSECLFDGQFMLNEFVDRFGPRLAHLNGVLQVLSQLSAVPQQEKEE